MDYAQLTLPHDSLGGISPFEVVHGYTPRTTWDWKTDLPDLVTPTEKINANNARKYTARHHEA